MTDDYHANLDQAERVHKGTVFGALKREWKDADADQAGTPKGRWWAYQGRQVKPFVAFTRFEEGWLTVTAIAGLGQGTGRMKTVCDALDRLAWEADLKLRFETVMSDALLGHLLRRGYRYSTDNPVTNPDLIYDPRRP